MLWPSYVAWRSFRACTDPEPVRRCLEFRGRRTLHGPASVCAAATRRWNPTDSPSVWAVASSTRNSNLSFRHLDRRDRQTLRQTLTVSFTLHANNAFTPNETNVCRQNKLIDLMLPRYPWPTQNWIHVVIKDHRMRICILYEFYKFLSRVSTALSCLDSPPHSLVSSSLLSSLLSSSITPSLFHSRLKTYLFNKFFPP